MDTSPHKMHHVHTIQGFTLFELAIVLAIIAIVAALAIPNAGNYVDNNRLSAAASDMAVALQTARAESVGRNIPVTMCVSNAGGTQCSGAADQWEKGWILFEDQDSDDTVDAGEEVIQYHDSLSGRVTIRGTSGADEAITFFPSGRTSITSTQTLILCDHRGFGEDAKGLVLSILGRASIMAADSTSENTCTPE